MSRKLLFPFAALMLLACSQSKQEVYTKSGFAVNGYDVVAYFKDSKAVKGSEDLAFQWNNATWLFSSQENLEDFTMSPEKYAPQYGGYCAFGTAEGHKAPTQPDAWTIVDGKLYLNYDKGVQSQWLKDTAGFILKADINWPDVKTQEF